MACASASYRHYHRSDNVQLILSLSVALAALSHQLCHLKLNTGGGGGNSSRRGFLTSCPADGEGRKPRGDVPLLVRPDAVVVDEDIYDHVDEDAEEGERGSSSNRWVSGSGPPGCFVLLWAPCGPLAPPVPERGLREAAVFPRPSLILEFA
jgi:hypothetical protein